MLSPDRNASSPADRRLPTADQSPAVHPWQFNGVVRLTKVGSAYILATIALAVAAVNTGNNALYITVSLMLGSLLLSGLASKGGLKQLELQIGGIDEAWAKRRVEGTIRIRNRSRIWSVRDVVLTSGAFAEPVLIPILPYGEATVPVSFFFPRRGIAHLAAVDSYTRYPFGFFLKKRRLRVDSEVVVYPQLLTEGASRERLRPSLGEQVTSARPGQGSEIHSFREYVRGDSLRQVHWKKSASLGRWIMKQSEADASQSIHIVVDPYKPQEASDEDFENMIASAATLIFDAARHGLDVTLSLPRVTVRARESESAVPLLRALALLEAMHEPVHQLLDRDAILFSLRTTSPAVGTHAELS